MPVVFIPFLVPPGCSADKVRYNLDELKKDGDVGGGGDGDVGGGGGGAVKQTELTPATEPPETAAMEDVAL